MPIDATHNLSAHQLQEWFRSALGQHLIDYESREFVTIVPHSYWPVGVNQGPGSADCFVDLDVQVQMNIKSQIDTMSYPTVVSRYEELPLGSNSSDLVVLQHTLDFSQDPRQVLREAIEVLRPNGWIIIFGFNPYSLWGATRLMKARSERPPWTGHFLRSKRVFDWLGLLGTEVVQCKYLVYRPPVRSASVLKQFSFLDIVGSWIWHSCGAIYMISAQKRMFAGHRQLTRKARTRQVAQALHTMKLGTKLKSNRITKSTS